MSLCACCYLDAFPLCRDCEAEADCTGGNHLPDLPAPAWWSQQKAAQVAELRESVAAAGARNQPMSDRQFGGLLLSILLACLLLGQLAAPAPAAATTRAQSCARSCTIPPPARGWLHRMSTTPNPTTTEATK